MMQTLFGAGDRNPFMSFKPITPWVSPTVGFDVALFWIKQWSRMTTLEGTPMSVFARAWSLQTGPTATPPADTPADIAFGSATDDLPAIHNPPVNAAAVLGLEPAPEPAPEPVAEAVMAPMVEAAPQPVVEAPVVEQPAAEVPAAAAADELTRIVGIGPKLAAALAREGVTQFAQIAAWKAKDLEKFDKALDLKGRAVRDAWVAQAKRFTETAAS